MNYASMIQPVLWIITGGVAAFFGVRAAQAWRRKNTAGIKRPLLLAGGALLLAVLLVPAIGVVPAGSRGVVYQWNGGISPKERGEGITFLVPWLQHLTVTSVRTQKEFSSKVFAQSSDLQEITVPVSVNYHVKPDRAAELYQTVGPQYASTVIQPALFQRTKAAIGKIKAEDFALKRDALAATVGRQLTSQLSGYGIVIEYVNIEDAIFDPAFVKAVKDKIIAEQKAKEQFRLIQAEANIKQQTIIKAEAEAKSTLIKATAQSKANDKLARSITPTLLRWQWLAVWDGILPSTLVGSDAAGLSLFLNSGASSSGGSSPYGPGGP